MCVDDVDVCVFLFLHIFVHQLFYCHHCWFTILFLYILVLSVLICLYTQRVNTLYTYVTNLWSHLTGNLPPQIYNIQTSQRDMCTNLLCTCVAVGWCSDVLNKRTEKPASFTIIGSFLKEKAWTEHTNKQTKLAEQSNE